MALGAAPRAERSAGNFARNKTVLAGAATGAVARLGIADSSPVRYSENAGQDSL
jgi:hypothetical protein